MHTHLPSSIFLSLLLHAVVAFVVGTAFVSCTSPHDSPVNVEKAEAIEATMLTEKEAMAYYEHKRAQEEERQRILEQQRAAERERKELEKKRKAQQIELQRRKKVEKRRKAEQLRLEKQRAAERKAKQEAEEREKALQEARKQEQKRRAEEEARRQAELKRLKAEHQEQLRMRKRQLSMWTKQYVSTLRRSVETQWKKPPASIKGGDCIVRVRQQNDGVVVDVRVVSCDGDKLYRSSVIEAVWKANPLPLPPVEDVFDSEIELTFKKEYGG